MKNTFSYVKPVNGNNCFLSYLGFIGVFSVHETIATCVKHIVHALISFLLYPPCKLCTLFKA